MPRFVLTMTGKKDDYRKKRTLNSNEIRHFDNAN